MRKGDGGYGYASTDMAALRHRVREERADRIIYVTDAGQALHFQSVFAAAEAAGYLDKPGAAGGASPGRAGGGWSRRAVVVSGGGPRRPGLIRRRRACARASLPHAPCARSSQTLH